jgi:drug/metabolite transporter superfamily protein YnfA
MYLLALVIGFALSYFAIAALFSLLFSSKLPTFSGKSARSVMLIAVLAIVIITLSLRIPDPQLSNRVLHAMGGGFMAVIVCFLAVRDMRLPINKFQFFAVSALIATSLGVVNELLEFFLQEYAGLMFSQTPLDTWLDLTSNAAGTALATAIFTPFIMRKG